MRTRAILIAGTLIVIGSLTQAQTVKFIRPASAFKKAEVEKTDAATETKSLDNVLEHKAKLITAELKKSGILQGLPESIEKGVEEALRKNESAQEIVRSIVNDRIAQHAVINKLRLEVLSQIPDLDLRNQKITNRASTDAQFAKELDIAKAVAGLNPQGASVKALERMAIFLTQVNKELLGAVDRADVLTFAKETLNIEKGIEINVEEIGFLADQGRLKEMFAGDDDVKTMEVRGPGADAPLVVRLSKNQAEKVDNQAWEKALKLMELVENPDSVGEAVADSAVQESQRIQEETSGFLKENPLLDRSSKLSTIGSETSAELQGNIDDLLRTLADYQATVKATTSDSVFAKASSAFKKTVLRQDPVSQMHTLREKINSLEDVISQSMIKADESNRALMKLKEHSLKRRGSLQSELAYNSLLAAHMTDIANQLEEKGQADKVQIIRAQILPRLQKDLNDLFALYQKLEISDGAIATAIETNFVVRGNAASLMRTVIPSIAITESLKAAGEEQRASLRQHEAITEFSKQQQEELIRIMKENNKAYIKSLETSALPVETATLLMKQIAEERASLEKRKIEAGNKMAAANAKFKEAMNPTAGVKHGDVGVAFQGLMHPGSSDQSGSKK